MDCRRLLVGESMSTSTNKTSPGTEVLFTCLPGHTMSGNQVLTCSNTGRWSSWEPKCAKPSESVSGITNDKYLIIGISATMSVVVLGVLIFAVVMLATNMRRDKRVKELEKEEEIKRRDINIYVAVSQDCVGMPSVTTDSINLLLRGRPSLHQEETATPVGNTFAAAERAQQAFLF